MRTRLMTVTITALSLAGALTLHAQAPQSPTAPPTQAPTARPADPQRPMTEAATKASDAVITVTGCVKSEADVPGLTPNVAASVTDDFILTNVKMSPASKVSGIGLASMYEIKELAGADVKKHVNHEVELTGRVSDKKDANDKAPDFHATAIKMLAATCAAQ